MLQRIEAWWSVLNKFCTHFWKALFKVRYCLHENLSLHYFEGIGVEWSFEPNKCGAHVRSACQCACYNEVCELMHCVGIV